MQRALSEMVVQFFFSSMRGSMSAIFMPCVTGAPSRMRPRSSPVRAAFTGASPTKAMVSPSRTQSPMRRSACNWPVAGLWMTRSAPWPAMMPGTPVLGAACP